MKSAKEWAAKVVRRGVPSHQPELRLVDECGEAPIECNECIGVEERKAAAMGIIERLAEQIQDDALDAFASYFKEQEESLWDGERLDFDYHMAKFREKYLSDREEG